MRDDIVSDIIARLAESLGADVVPPEVMLRLEAEIRRNWAGETVYIRAERTRARDARIVQQWRDGASVDSLAARHGLSERRIRQIINTRRR